MSIQVSILFNFFVRLSFRCTMRLLKYSCTLKSIVFSTFILLFLGIIAGCTTSPPEESVDIPTLPPTAAGSPEEMLPKFPWPAPQASSREMIESALLKKVGSHPTLGDVNSLIITALQKIGYTEFSYFAVPKGYALVTRLEKINEDGSPKRGLERWETNRDAPYYFSLERYLRTLFTANKGFYRIVVFTVSPNILIEGKDKISEKEALDWLRTGGVSLPAELAKIPFSEKYNCAALIYEFEQIGPKTEVKFLSPGRLPTHLHLEATGFYQALGEQNAN